MFAFACASSASPAPATSLRSAGVTPAPSVLSTEQVVAAARPVGYELQAECQYTGSGAISRGTTWWPIRCPTGLPFALVPSLAAQGWEYCGCGGLDGCIYRTNEWILLVRIDRAPETGELGQRPRAERPGITPSDCGPLPTAP